MPFETVPLIPYMVVAVSTIAYSRISRRARGSSVPERIGSTTRRT
jgi:hypothetical protein